MKQIFLSYGSMTIAMVAICYSMYLYKAIGFNLTSWCVHVGVTALIASWMISYAYESAENFLLMYMFSNFLLMAGGAISSYFYIGEPLTTKKIFGILSFIIGLILMG